MKAWLAWLGYLVFALAPAAFAENGVEIVEVGLGGYYSSAATTPVRTKIAVPAGTQSIQLQFTLTSGSIDSPAYQPMRVDHFSHPFQVKPGEVARLDSPLLLTGIAPNSPTERSELDLTVVDSSGHVIGKSGLGLGSLAHVDGQVLVVMICGDRQLCDEVQSQISYSGSSEETGEKNQRMKFLALAQPRENWWDYAAAKFVVVAEPVSKWTPAERAAVELYLRGGGRVILLQKKADASFLSAYRQKAAQTEPVLVGQGKLYALAELDNNSLGPIFQGPALKSILNQEWPFRSMDASLSDWVRERVAVSFNFPRLRWVLGWMAVYTLVVGLLNFVVLSRLRRMEWGWITTASIAIVFALGLYVASSANRPKEVTLDEIAIYWMDSHSGIASKSLGVRVSSPQRQSISLKIAEDALLAPRINYRQNAPNAQIATDITNTRHSVEGRDMSLGLPQQIELPLLRWSFTDLGFRAFHSFTGSVSVSPDSRLKNATGQRFREAVYLDLQNNKQYVLPPLAPDEEVDLKAITPKVIWTERGVGPSKIREWNKLSQQEKGFSLADMTLAGYLDEKIGCAFVGINEGDPSTASVSVSNFLRHDLAVTVVAVDRP